MINMMIEIAVVMVKTGDMLLINFLYSLSGAFCFLRSTHFFITYSASINETINTTNSKISIHHDPFILGINM